MPMQHTVLLVGGTGRTGSRVLAQLLDRGVRVRAIVRAFAKVPPGLASNANLALIQADLLSLRDEELQEHLRGCNAVISCLGHVISFRGVFGRPRDLVTSATIRLCRSLESLRPPTPVKFILMSSVSVNRPQRLDARRSAFERALLWLIRCLVPPAKDNQQAAEFFLNVLGTSNGFIQWVAVRPDSLQEGDVSDYTVHDGISNRILSPGRTNMANVAHFMCQLVCNRETWDRWKFELPVITNAS